MRAMLFTRLGLTGVTSEVSQAVSMEEANAVVIDYVVFSLSGTGSPAVTITLQLSNDLENWTSFSGMTNNAPTAAGYGLSSTATGIATAYVRLKASLSGTTPVAVVSAGVNTSLL